MATQDSKPVPPRVQNLIGKRFDRYKVVAYHHVERNNYGTRHFWVAECDCGTVKVVRSDTLKNKTVKSCGCYNRENARRKLTELATTHGMSKKPIYAVWCAMKARCHRKNDNGYSYYGARGIKVCKRWRESFEAFYDDMGDRPSPRHELERVDNDGDYEPENCVWTTKTKQANNTRKNRYIEIDGVTKTLAQWAREYNINQSTLTSRLNRGWEIKEALTTAVYGRWKRRTD